MWRYFQYGRLFLTLAGNFNAEIPLTAHKRAKGYQDFLE